MSKVPEKGDPNVIGCISGMTDSSEGKSEFGQAADNAGADQEKRNGLRIPFPREQML